MRFDDALGLLPPAWRSALAGCRAEPAPGLGGASVFALDGADDARRYLKVARGAGAGPLAREIERTRWLASRGVRVPEFLMTAVAGDVAAVVMAEVPGSHPGARAGDPCAMAQAIGRGLARLHALPAASCPFDEMPGTRLARALEAIGRHEIDARDFDRRNAGVTPEALYRRLAAALPDPEDVVVVHGDATLDNLLIGPDGELGFIDCGHAGQSDRYVDLAVTEAELRNEFGDDAAEAFRSACAPGGWEDRKAAYFADLYELF